MSQQQQQAVQVDPCQCQFDEILVEKNGSCPKPISPSLLSFDKKSIYAGDNANWKLNFKDLKTVEQSLIERDVYDDDNDFGRRGHNGRHGGSGSRGRGGHATSEILVLSLSGRKIGFKCTVRKGPTAKAFIQGLKANHRKVKVKGGGKDPYAFDESKKSFGQSRSAIGGSGRASSLGGKGSIKSRVTQITPSQSSLYLSPTKKKHRTSGAFQSPARPRGNSIGRSGGKAEGYQQFRPEEDDFEVSGNVVNVPDSPANRKLNLPPKSPRNATPTKLRSLSVEGKANLRSKINQLDGISGGNIKLRKKVDESASVDLMVGNGDSSNEEFDHAEIVRKRRLKKETQAREQSQEGETEKEEVSMSEGDKDSDVPKRRRLQKAASGEKRNDDSYDSDVEFDDDVNLSSCKKKLSMSIGDDDDDDEEEEGSVKAGEKSSEKEASKDEEVPPTPYKKSPQAEATEDESDKPKQSTVDILLDDYTKEEANEPKQSTADKVLAPSPKKKTPAKGSIQSFFGAKSASNKPSATSTASKKENKSPSPQPDTYGAALTTPSKKVRSEGKTPTNKSLPSTPPHRTDTTKPTPVPKQSQRKQSRYFGNMNMKGVATNKPSKYPKYSDEENENDLPEYQDDGGYYNDENAHDKDLENEYQAKLDQLSPMKTATLNKSFHNATLKRTPYGRQSTGMLRGRTGGLGTSRLASRNIHSNNTCPRIKNFNNPYSSFNAKSSSTPSKADAALGRSGNNKRKWDDKYDDLPALIPVDKSPKPDTPKIPGIQNLGNTCYLSASLQTLFSIPRFMSDLYKTYESQSATGKKLPLTRALLEVATAIGVLSEGETPKIDAEVAKSKLSTSQAANPAALKKQMDVLTDKFAGYEQRDAHELLGDLVDYLHDELAAPVTPTAAAGEAASGSVEGTTTEGTTATTEGGSEEGRAASPNDNKNPNEAKEQKEGDKKEDAAKSNAPTAAVQHEHGVLPTDEYFHLNVKVCLECDSCGYSRSKDEMYRHLSVDVGEDSDLEKWTVERSLKQFFQPEKREIKCEKCESGETATQTMEIISCPKALLLHFKRFIVTQEMKGGPSAGDKSDGKENNKAAAQPRMEMVLKKNKAKIPLEESLSMNQFIGKNEESPSGKYHLRGVVHHIGFTAFSGHYTACAKRTLKAEGDGGKSDTTTGAPDDNEEQWVFFDDRVGTKKSMEYVTGYERNQRNCYMALYELK